MTATPAQIDRYTNGQCHAFAEALSVATGGQMVLWSEDDGETGHCMVRLADGRYADVTGAHTLADMAAMGWNANEVSDIEDADSLGWEHPVINDDARALAATIAEDLR